MSEVVLARPMDELAVPNAKYVKECTELYLANKGITELDGFEPFVNLETLWINGNRLEYLDDLDDCVRLKHLYAHDNILNTLEGSLGALKNLQTLNLSNNNISDLHSVIELLKTLVHLETLDLSGNPAAEEDKYRRRVIAALPKLKVFDGITVKPKEAAAAAATAATAGRRPGESHESNKNTTKKKGGSISWQDNMSTTVKLAEKENARIEQAEREREQRERLAQFQNLEVLRSKSLKEAPISKYSQAPSHRTQRDGGERLSEWDLLRGRQLFDQYDKNGNGFLSRAELQNVIQDMEEEGYLLREGEEETLDSLLTVLDTNHDGKISWAEFERGLNGEAVDSQGKRISRALRWRCLSASEARTRSDELYSLAQKMQMKLGMLDDSSEAHAAERQELKAEILRISQLANRFSVLAQGKSSTSQLQSNDRDASHGSNNSDNNSNLQAELKGRRRARRPAPRGDDIRFFEWDVEEPKGQNEDWSSDDEDEEAAKLKAEFGLDHETHRAIKQTRRATATTGSRTKRGTGPAVSTPTRHFKGFSKSSVF